MNEIKEQPKQELSSDINIITAEINAYQQIAGEAVFEIGRRLHRVKYNPLKYELPEGRDKHGNVIVARGYWGKWLKGINMTYQQADRFIRVFTELDAGNYLPSSNKGIEALYHIATLPESEREAEHTTSKGEQKTPAEMTVRELRKLKTDLKKAEEQRNQAQQQAELERKERERLEALANKPPEVRVETKTEYIEPDDYEDLRRENETYRRLYGDSTIYEENTRRVGNDDAITYNVFEFSEDVRKFIEKYGHLTHFPKEFNEMIPEGKAEFQSSITQLLQFLGALDRSMQEGTVIINQ